MKDAGFERVKLSTPPAGRALRKALVAYKEEDVGWNVGLVQRQGLWSTRSAADRFVLSFEAEEQRTIELDPFAFIAEAEDIDNWNTTPAAGSWCVVAAVAE